MKMEETIRLQAPLPLWRQVWNFLRLTRALFLVGGWVQYALGAAAAWWLGARVDLWGYLAGQATVTLIQLMAHYRNELDDQDVDRRIGAERTWFSGGSGMLVSGAVSLRAARWAVRICAVLAVFSGAAAAWLAPAAGPWMALGWLGAWCYSAPPVRLVQRGWGEAATTLIVAWLVPATAFALQGGQQYAALAGLCLPLAAIHLAMLIAFEIPDLRADREAGKRTLTVRLGAAGAARLHTLALGLAALLALALAGTSDLPLAGLGISLPLAVWQALLMHRTVQSPTRRRYWLLTGGAIVLFGLSAVLVLAGLALRMLSGGVI